MYGGYVRSFLSRETFFLDCDDLRDLVRSEWPFPRWLWLLYRTFAALYLVAVLIWAFVVKYIKYQWKFFTFLSHWAYLILVFSFVLKFIVAVKYSSWLRKEKEEDRNEKKPLIAGKTTSWKLERPHNTAPSLVQFSWLVNNIATAISLHVTVGFYSGGQPANPVSETLNFQIHAVNSIFAAFDFVVVKQPTILLHFYQPACFYLSYISFTAFYYLAGGLDKNGRPYIYPWTNWTVPDTDMLLDQLVSTGKFLAFYVIMWATGILREMFGSLLFPSYHRILNNKDEMKQNKNKSYA